MPRTATRRKPPRGREILAWFPAMAGCGRPGAPASAERAAADAGMRRYAPEHARTLATLVLTRLVRVIQ